MINPEGNDTNESPQIPAENRIACAHLRVDWTTITKDGVTTGYWVCGKCGLRFVPAPVLSTLVRERDMIANEMFRLDCELVRTKRESVILAAVLKYWHHRDQVWRERATRLPFGNQIITHQVAAGEVLDLLSMRLIRRLSYMKQQPPKESL